MTVLPHQFHSLINIPLLFHYPLNRNEAALNSISAEHTCVHRAHDNEFNWLSSNVSVMSFYLETFVYRCLFMNTSAGLLSLDKQRVFKRFSESC